MRFKDKCDIGFQVQFNAEFTSQVINFPIEATSQHNLSGSSSREVSRDWLDTLLEDNRTTDNGNNAPSPKTTTAVDKQNYYKLTRVATLLKEINSFFGLN